MNEAVKGMIIVLIVLYNVSPIDAIPGPVDDLIAALIGYAATRRHTVEP